MSTQTDGEHDGDLVSRLYAEIEETWANYRDGKAVERVIERYPEHEDLLTEFYELLLDSELDVHLGSDEAEVTGRSVGQWLESEGYELARAAAERERGRPPGATVSTLAPPGGEIGQSLPSDTPQTKSEVASLPLVGLLREATRLRLDDIARALEMRKGLLVQVSEHPETAPPPWKREIARRAERKLRVPQAPVLASMDQPPEYAVAALRDAPYEQEALTFEILLDRAGLTDAERAFWRSLATSDDS